MTVVKRYPEHARLKDDLGRPIIADLGGGRRIVEADTRNDDWILTASGISFVRMDMEDAQRLYNALGKMLRHYRGQWASGGIDHSTGEPFPL